MDKVSMSYIFSFSRYQTNCVIEFLFRQLKRHKLQDFIFDHRPKQRRQTEKEQRTETQKLEYLEREKNFLGEIKSIFHIFEELSFG